MKAYFFYEELYENTDYCKQERTYRKQLGRNKLEQDIGNDCGFPKTYVIGNSTTQVYI